MIMKKREVEPKQGAASSFLYDTLQRINEAMGRSYEDYLIDLSEGFMVSADNAHGLHPNHQEKADPVNRPVVGGGIVIKFNAAQKYCTDGASAAFFRQICKKAGLKTQNFTNRSDIAGGSTLGNLSNLMVPMKKCRHRFAAACHAFGLGNGRCQGYRGHDCYGRTIFLGNRI